MVEFEVFIKRLSQLPTYLYTKAPQLLVKKQQQIITLNRVQMKIGENIKGEIIQKGYSKTHEKKRKEKGLQTGFVDLKFTGKYYDTLKAKKADKGVNIISGTSYGKYLKNMFPEHRGLTEKSAEIIAEDLEKEVADLIKKYLLR